MPEPEYCECIDVDRLLARAAIAELRLENCRRAAERASGGLEWRRLAWAMWVAEDVERLGVPFLAWWNDAGNQRHVMRVWLEVNNFGPDAEAIAARLTGGQDDE